MEVGRKCGEILEWGMNSIRRGTGKRDELERAEIRRKCGEILDSAGKRDLIVGGKLAGKLKKNKKFPCELRQRELEKTRGNSSIYTKPVYNFLTSQCETSERLYRKGYPSRDTSV